MQVARRALIQIAIGVALGLPLAGMVFFEMQEQSASQSAWLAVGLALAQGVGFLLIVALAACLVPTLRALRISPVEVLKGD